MTDEEIEQGPQPSRDGDSYLYDFFKYMTSLSLLTLGGALTVAQMADADDLKQHTLLLVMAPIAASTLLAFSGALELVKARSRGTAPARTVQRMLRLAPAAFLLGVGAFLAMFVDVMF